MAREATRGIERCRIGGGQEDKGWRKGRVRTRLLIPEIGVFVSCSSRAWLLVGTRENLTRKQKHFLPLWVGLCHSWHRGSALLTPLYVVGYPPMYSPAPMYSRPCPAWHASAPVKPTQTLPRRRLRRMTAPKTPLRRPRHSHPATVAPWQIKDPSSLRHEQSPTRSLAV